MSTSEIQKTTDDIFNKMGKNQFGNDRYAILFKPGSYNANVNVGFYTSVIGLGESPDDVNITGGVHSEADWMNGNATCNFWRTVENLSVTPTYISNKTTSVGTQTWAVSQAAPMRRVHIKGSLSLWDPTDNNYSSAWSSGGFIADSKIDNKIISGTQQQFFTRNSNMGSWDGSNWNMVFVGNNGAPTNDNAYPAVGNTIINKTSAIREKPFLTIDKDGNYSVFVPDAKNNSKGVSWENGIGLGTSLSIDKFAIAKPDTSTAASLNKDLSDGKNIIFTPGVYHLNEALKVTNPNTVILGLGLATLIPDYGDVVMKISDVDGVKVSGILFDAGEKISSTLLEVGEEGSSSNHSSNPTTLSDLFFRVGGAGAGIAQSCVKINSNNVIGDDFWVWRADHGDGVGWTTNPCDNGLIVNGNNVIIYGLFTEHFNKYQTIWNGNGGKVYFYQSEMPYDVPNQAAWMSSDDINGYASYKVSDKVTSHELYGAGVYSYFRDANVAANSAIEVPNTRGIKIRHACSVFLNNNVNQPIITPKIELSSGPQTITIDSKTPRTTVRYTTDGTDPTSANGIIYTGPFTVSKTTTVKAIAYKSGMSNSSVASSVRTIIPDLAKDLAFGKESTASTGSTNLAFDGDTATRWESAWDDKQYITLDLGSDYNITGVNLTWETAAGKDYKIQLSSDNKTWTDAYIKTNGTGGTEYITFESPIKGIYVKMQGIKRSTNWGYSLWQFEVYGNKYVN
jgi:hypothetical protein